MILSEGGEGGVAREQALVEGVSAGAEGENGEGSGSSSLATPGSCCAKRVTFEEWMM